MSQQFSKMKVGILGGGQLARMLIQQGQRLGLRMHVLCPGEEDPAALVTRHWHQGSPTKESDLRRFFAQVDVVTFESEFLDALQLQQVAEGTGTPLFPRPELMGKLQDRLIQKQLLEKYKITTSPFMEVSNRNQLDEALQKFPKGLVLKKRRFGYDGYGTFIVRNRQNASKVEGLLSEVKDGFIAESFVTFRRELALMAVRSINGEVSFLPLVESQQKDNRCFWVKGPLRHRSLGAITKKIKTLLGEIDYVGAIGFEFFDTAQGLVVNEVAPRVHNSGHYSLDALNSDQFTLHIKALLGMKLGTVELRKPGFAMLNLLGEMGGPPTWNLPPNLNLHWYGKSDNRPGRKMGHLTALGSGPQTALARLLKAKKEFHL